MSPRLIQESILLALVGVGSFSRVSPCLRALTRAFVSVFSELPAQISISKNKELPIIQNREHSNMTRHAGSKSLRLSFRSARAAIFLGAALSTVLLADDGAKPDSAGPATGDKTSVAAPAANLFLRLC